MEPKKLLLLAELPGLEAARRCIDQRISEIEKELSVGGGTYERPPAILDPTILGRDVLGRIKRKRNITPEVREQKRALIAKARQARIEKIKGLEKTVADLQSAQERSAHQVAAHVPQPPHKKKR